MVRILIVLVLFACGSRAWGWSIKEHIQLTRIAAMRLMEDPKTPVGMKQWLGRNGFVRDMAAEKEYFLGARVGVFAQGARGLSFWAAMPDLVGMADKQERPVEGFGVNEQKLHFIDVEYFHPEKAKQRYRHDLSGRPKLADFPRDIEDPRYKRAGMLPFRVEHAYQQMVAALRQGRLEDMPGRFPRDEHGVKWAGYLAHYLQDNTQPHHATEDYQSRSYFGGMKRPPSVHGDMEYRLVDDEMEDYPGLRAELWELFVKALEEVRDPVDPADAWKSSLEVALISYEALPMIGMAAVAAYPEAKEESAGRWDAAAFFHYKGKYLGREMTVMEMKAHQLAWAVKRVEGMWRRGWEEAMR